MSLENFCDISNQNLKGKLLTNNDILRRLRFITKFNDQKMVDVFALGGVRSA